ncbi:histidine ammonia-lyase [Streptomyces sulfonofaciens]|uniref:Histidine ammonia-lyase n=1 Tax=Streptomyces sulfonofaciens TaxID=68272 RepID=A0A919FRC3_9ACTN|nr:aromatic amino acid ammonia-lyase [Streptomyces sulfonofaciens]GHH71000.1 histidine ammonia-lyase [Streptomyces sulfonofaciens]
MLTTPVHRSAPPDPVVLDGHTLDATGVTRLADVQADPRVDPAALTRMETTWRAARQLTKTGRIYGRSTGVGAHRSVEITPQDADGHDLRLLASHAGGIGAPLPARQVRAMLAVRINQLLAGGSGLRPAIVLTLAEALRARVHPEVNEYGAIGTGDLTALAQLGLTLVGRRPWSAAEPQAGDPPAAIPMEPGDALGLLSSNALTLGQAALVCHDLGGLLRASHAVTALSLLAVEGSLEAYAAPVHAARPHPGSVHTAAEVRRLLGAPDRPEPPAGRIQDPFAFRCFPQQHGPALEACAALERVLAVDLNCAAENPLFTREGPGGGPGAYHHGGFFAAPLTLALDQLCLAVLGTARLSAARLVALGRSDLTGLPSFLTDGTPGSSGMMILEHSATGALAEVEACAAPASLSHAVLAQGVEEAASFATQASRKALRAIGAYRLVLGCELLAAVRALRLRGCAPDPALPAGQAFALAAAALDPETADRPLTADVAAAAAVLDDLPGL